MNNLWVILFDYDYIQTKIPVEIRNIILDFVFAVKMNNKNKSICYYLL